MENSLLIGLSRQMALGRQMEVVANNLANARTTGYKGESLIFEEVLMDTARAGDIAGSAGKLSYVVDARAARDFGEGPMTPTGNPLDIAINGKGWLVVQTQNGERYTRNGRLKIDEQGQIVNGAGQPVLSDAGVITIGAEETGLTISSDGTVSTDAGQKGKIRVVTFENENALKKEGASLYRTDAAAQPAENYRISQGVIEGSNVEPVREIARMIEVMRSYVSTAKMLNNTAELKRRAIEELGRLPASG